MALEALHQIPRHKAREEKYECDYNDAFIMSGNMVNRHQLLMPSLPKVCIKFI